MQQFQVQGCLFFSQQCSNSTTESFSEKVAVPSLYIISAWGQLLSNFQHIKDLVEEYILQIYFTLR